MVLVKGAAAFATREGVEWTSSSLKRHTATVRLFFEEPGGEGQDASGSQKTAARAGASQNQASQPSGRGRGAAAGQEEAPDPDKPPTREMDLVRTPGAILRVKVDPEHFLGFGYDGDLGATIQSNYAFRISREGQNVAAFPDEDTLKLAGFMWPEARKALAKSLYLWLEPAGRGQVILFADDPVFRAAQLSTVRMLFNAICLGPAFVR
jgi:hypothetical protein